MNPKRIWIMFIARNYEFFRDKAAFGWNFLFPFLILAGFSLIFGEEAQRPYKIGVFPLEAGMVESARLDLPESLLGAKYVQFIGAPSLESGQELLRRHRIDLLLENGRVDRHWIADGPNSHLAGQIVAAAVARDRYGPVSIEKEIKGRQVRYIDWFFPGLLGMNVMMSALWGVGYIIVRYRKNGALKRLKVTPLTAVEYLTAQMFSRIFLILFTLVILFAGCGVIFDLDIRGGYGLLFLVYAAGCAALCSLGMIVASRGTSEEFASGVVNFITWPMMFLSEVWFSLEGSPDWILTVSDFLPLTHMIRSARLVMNDGAGFMEVAPSLGILAAMTIACTLIAAALFSWTE